MEMPVSISGEGQETESKDERAKCVVGRARNSGAGTMPNDADDICVHAQDTHMYNMRGTQTGDRDSKL